MELRRVSARLAQALEKIELIEGLIPICSYCKSIRNDAGYWSSVEIFLQEHADLGFTHGVCQDCIEKHFPEVAEAIRQDGGTGSPRVSQRIPADPVDGSTSHGRQGLDLRREIDAPDQDMSDRRPDGC